METHPRYLTACLWVLVGDLRLLGVRTAARAGPILLLVLVSHWGLIAEAGGAWRKVRQRECVSRRP